MDTLQYTKGFNILEEPQTCIVACIHCLVATATPPSLAEFGAMLDRWRQALDKYTGPVSSADKRLLHAHYTAALLILDLTAANGDRDHRDTAS